MYTQYQDTDSGVSKGGDVTESEWYTLYDAVDVPESLGAWTLKDFADILQDVGLWR
jgi:hypothetical protein